MGSRNVTEAKSRASTPTADDRVSHINSDESASLELAAEAPSSEWKQKAERIKDACTARDVVALAELARSRDGLLTDQLRGQACKLRCLISRIAGPGKAPTVC
jgi:hypothetical protein